jgi:hypothetical protein
MLAHAVESLSQVFRVLLQFLGAVDHFLMEDLVAVNEIAHPTAEYWATLSHLDVHIALSSNQVRDGPGIFYFRGCLNIFFELLLIFLTYELLEEKGRLELFTSGHSGQEASEVLFSLVKFFLSPLGLDRR